MKSKEVGEGPFVSVSAITWETLTDLLDLSVCVCVCVVVYGCEDVRELLQVNGVNCYGRPKRWGDLRDV